MNYLAIPKAQVSFDGTFPDGFSGGSITLEENKLWEATLTFSNAPAIYPSVVDKNTPTDISVRDEAVGGAYTTIFSGKVLYPTFSFDGSTATVNLKCVGQGYGLNAMSCAEEYGQQSRNPTLDSLQEILTDASFGMIPKWVNKYKATAYDSGYNLDTTYVEDLSGTIPFINFPWKPAAKGIDDLCDLNTALIAPSAGAQWIVDNFGYLRVKQIGVTQTGWTKYYGNSQANATLVNGEDFFDGNFQSLNKEANVILYYGVWRRPSSGDAWTENSASQWGAGASNAVTDSDVQHVVNAKSIKITATGAVAVDGYYPSTQDAGWNFGKFSEFMRPILAFGIWSEYTAGFQVWLYDSSGNYCFANISSAANKWVHTELPIGWYHGLNKQATPWTTVEAAFDWEDIDYIQFLSTGTPGYLYVDGLYFGGAPICRIARQEFPDEIAGGRGTLGTDANPIVFKVLTDNVGKDDSLTDATDTGLMAQMAKYELLRATSEPIIGSFSTPLIPTVLPGQYFYIGEDWRITKVTHNLSTFRSSFEVTNDLINSHSRSRYEDINKVYAANRPEWQDRAATSIKVGDMDIRVLPLEKAYNI